MISDLKDQLEERRARVQELRKYMDGQVTETQLMQASGAPIVEREGVPFGQRPLPAERNVAAMQVAISVLLRSNSSSAERLRALKDLQALVEPIDNANGVKCPAQISIYLDET